MDKKPSSYNDATVIEDIQIEKENISSVFNLVGLKIGKYTISNQVETVSGEADIFTAFDNEQEYILKLYRFGFKPNESIINKIKDITIKYSENLIKILDFGYDESTKKYYEILEYAKFGNLRKYKFNNSKKKYDDLTDVIFQINDGLKKLHDQDILHLDLKPENILIRQMIPLDIVLSDFGISTKLENNTNEKVTTVKGTDSYWSPESVVGVVSKKSDYWSLGIVILEILMGENPFKEFNNRFRRYYLITKDIEIPEKINFKYKILLKGLLNKDADKRWGENDLDKWLKNYEKLTIYDEVDAENSDKVERENFKKKKYFYEEKNFLGKAVSIIIDEKKIFLSTFLLFFIFYVINFSIAFSLKNVIFLNFTKIIAIYLIYNFSKKKRYFVLSFINLIIFALLIMFSNLIHQSLFKFNFTFVFLEMGFWISYAVIYSIPNTVDVFKIDKLKMIPALFNNLLFSIFLGIGLGLFSSVIYIQSNLIKGNFLINFLINFLPLILPGYLIIISLKIIFKNNVSKIDHNFKNKIK